MHVRKSYRYLLIPLFLVFFVGCSGSSTSNQDSNGSDIKQDNIVPTPSVTISGKVDSYIDNNNSIYIRDIQGKELAQGEIKDNGYSITLSEFKKQDILLEVGKYKKLVLKDDNLKNQNITLLTTLVSSMMKKNSSDLKKERKVQIDRLSNIGLLDASDWDKTDVKELNSTLVTILEKDSNSSEWLDLIVSDLNDDDLSPQNMALFPLVHGGVVSTTFGDNKHLIKVMSESQTDVSLESITLDKKEKYDVEVITGADKLKVDTSSSNWTVTIDTTSILDAKTIPYKLRVYNKDTQKGRFYEGKISVLKSKILAEGTISEKGGRVLTDDKEYGIEIPAGELSEAVDVKIISAKNSNGEEIVSFKFEGKMPKDVKVKWIVPLETKKSNVQEKPSGSLFYKNLNYEIDRGYEYAKNGARLFSDVDGYINLECSNDLNDKSICRINIIKRKQWKLMTVSNFNSSKLKKSQPVLFVHGYAIGSKNFGGGDGTWGRFPELIEQTDDIIDTNGEKVNFVPFEFRWKTNTKFELAGDDLAKAIQKIYELTGKKVLIIAHSFGGVLTRTMIQNPNTNTVNNLVAGVVSLGSPYSGIANNSFNINNMQLPKGYDSDAAGFLGGLACKQISCYQMGDNMNSYNKNEFGSIISLIQKETSWSEKIPLTVGIGLKFIAKFPTLDEYLPSTGDGLISVEGQRFNIENALSSSKLFKSRNIEEKVIGVDTILEDIPKDNNNFYYKFGYAHSYWSGFTHYYQSYEANIKKDECSLVNANLCQHGSYKLVHEAFSKYLATDDVNFVELVKPQGLKNSVLKNIVNIDWSDVSGAVKYKIYFSYKNNFSIDEALANAELFSSKARYTLEDNCKKLYYRVEAIDKNGNSALSDVDVIVPPCIVLSGYVHDSKNNAIENATIKLQVDTNKTHNKIVTTDSNGSYAIDIASSAKYIILNVQAEGYENSVIQIEKDTVERYGFTQKNIILLKAGASIVKFNDGDILYHLGDDKYRGNVNSQLYLPTIGLSKELTFNITQEQLDNYTHARLKFYVRGAQIRNYLYINNTQLGYISSSPYNGSFGRYYWNININLLHLGINHFKITSNLGWPNDHDDFEFTNVMIKFYDHKPTRNEKIGNEKTEKADDNEVEKSNESDFI